MYSCFRLLRVSLSRIFPIQHPLNTFSKGAKTTIGESASRVKILGLSFKLLILHVVSFDSLRHNEKYYIPRYFASFTDPIIGRVPR